MMLLGYFIALFLLFVYSWAFVDLNLHLTNANWFTVVQQPLSRLVYEHMKVAGVLYVAILLALYGYYAAVMRFTKSRLESVSPAKVKLFFFAVAGLLLFSFPAFTYDIFNYMTTARVLYAHKENPYIVMPIEISNEPALAYTRAANKVALYGPVWLAVSYVPYVIGRGNVWLTMISFKAVMSMGYLLMLFLIWKNTGSMRQVLFFGLNPLVLIEILVSAHNDIVMMVLAVLAIGAFGLRKENLIDKVTVWALSVGIKGATIVLLPILFLRSWDTAKRYTAAYWLLFGVFVIFAPIREELYPWYAVWFLSFGALIPITKKSFLHGFSLALSIGLSFRHLPYILTREYAGVGPMLRILFTVIPVLLYCGWYVKTYGLRTLIATALYGKTIKD